MVKFEYCLCVCFSSCWIVGVDTLCNELALVFDNPSILVVCRAVFIGFDFDDGFGSDSSEASGNLTDGNKNAARNFGTVAIDHRDFSKSLFGRNDGRAGRVS